MKTAKWLTAAAIATAMIASPAMAKDKMKHAGMKKHHASKHSMMRRDRSADRGIVYNDRSDNGFAFNDSWDRNDNYDRGFFPGDVVGGVVGGAVATAGAAVNTAGAIATAPFGGYNNGSGYNNGYAYNNGYGNSYASYDNGFDRDWDLGFNNGWTGNDNRAYGDEGYRTRRQVRATTPGVSPLNNGSNAVNASASYAERNGFVCTPGSFYKNTNGRQVLCQ